MKIAYFPYTRKPDYQNLYPIDYNAYWETRGLQLPQSLNDREEIIFSLIEAHTSIMDIGCGISRLPLKLIEKGCQVTVADISDRVLDQYKPFGVKTIRIDLEKLDDFSIKDRCDCIILSEVLEHTRNPEEIIGFFKKHTSRFILTVPNSAYFRYRWHLFFCGRFFTQWVYHPSEHLRFWSHLDFLDWLRAMGLTVESTTASSGFSLRGLFPNLKNTFPNLFGHQIVYVCGQL